MYVLRPYQSEAVARGLDFLKRGEGNGLIVAPTGSGKSLVIAGIATQLTGPSLIFQPSLEILQQNATKLLGYGYEPAVYSASAGSKEIGGITLATIGSVRNNPGIFSGVEYVIVDEAHLVGTTKVKDPDGPDQGGMYQQFFKALAGRPILGLTATPYRLSADSYGGAQLKFLTRTKPRTFEQVVHFTQIGDLIRDGYLVKPTYQPVSGFSRAAMQFNSTGSDYTDDSVRRHFNHIGFADRLVRVVRRLLDIGRRNVLTFTRFVDEAEALAAEVPGTMVLSGDTKPKDREALVAGFRAGEIQSVATVGVLGTGFDFPELETVVLARPTVSLSLFYQQVGRVTRPHLLKKDAWVVDMVDNLGMFGKIEDLWLRPGGVRGQSWEVVTNGRPLTNVYFAAGRSRKGVPSGGRSRWSRRNR